MGQLIYESRFLVGDKVWIMGNNIPRETEVKNIVIEQVDTGTCTDNAKITYTLSGCFIPYKENKIFKTKDELLDSLR